MEQDFDDMRERRRGLVHDVEEDIGLQSACIFFGLFL